ncbi:MAG: Tm-1-like ATP-binding domain-containing protein [Anaerolineae bacterium]|jgi:uncharacterized protein (UPF0261 family)
MPEPEVRETAGRYVAILGSLDTKGQEIEFLRGRVRAEGGEPLVVDTGVLDSPTIPADIDRHRVVAAAGTSIKALIRKGDKAYALVTMADGAAAILHTLFQQGQLGGVLSIGGSRGTALSTRVMQALPVGVPKLMVSTMASGHNPFGPYVGTKDVTLMHSVADVQGINAVTRPIFMNAAAAIVAMSRVGAPVQRAERRVLAASMLGVSTMLVGQIQDLMADEGSEVIAFHAVGTGGRSMEELIDNGVIDGVFDVTPGEMTALVVDGPFSAGPGRMQAAGRRGIPQVLAPGGLDFIIEGRLDALPDRYKGRKTMGHTPTISLVRTSAEEMASVAHLIAQRLAASSGPAAAILPLRGFGWFAREGQPLHEPESDRAFVETFKDHVPARVRVVEMDTHLNDPRVGEVAVQLMQEMLAVAD